MTVVPMGCPDALALGAPPPDPPEQAARSVDADTVSTATVIARARLREVIRP